MTLITQEDNLSNKDIRQRSDTEHNPTTIKNIRKVNVRTQT